MQHPFIVLQVTFENLCLVYNGYTQTPEYFTGLKACRAVVPQSFSFDADAFIAWDVKHGNTHNPWNLPSGKASSSFVGQLCQSAILAKCDPAFHRSAFFKFCVNNAANLLSVIKQKCCRDLVRCCAFSLMLVVMPCDHTFCAASQPVCSPPQNDLQVNDPDSVAIMRAILAETFDVLELDAFYAAVVPMHREEFVRDVIFDGKGSVASYAGHFPSSHQHYLAGKLVDTRALNGYVVRKARELNAQAPINECAPAFPPLPCGDSCACSMLRVATHL